MRFDGNVYYHQGEPYPHGKMMREWTETAKLLDQGGFTTCWLGGTSLLGQRLPGRVSQPGAGRNASRLRYQPSSSRAKRLHSPRPPSDTASRGPGTLDQLTEGRLDVGIARGTNSSACIQFHPAADRRDSATNYRLFEETYDVLLGAWTQEVFKHKGEFYEFPVTGLVRKRQAGLRGRPHYGPNGELIALGVTPNRIKNRTRRSGRRPTQPPLMSSRRDAGTA